VVFTFTVIEVEWVRAPDVPVTITVYVPAVTEGSSTMVKVEAVDPLLGGVTGFGLKLLSKFPGPEEVRLTADENVSIELTVTDEVPDPPTTILIGEVAVREKSGTSTVNEAVPELLLLSGSSGEEACTLAVLVTIVPRVNPEFSFPEMVIVCGEFAVRVE